MTSSRACLAGIAAVCALMLTPVLAAQIDILTNRYDAQRSGANLAETALTAANVTAGKFGKLSSFPVDGAVYAQPLYVSGLSINGAVRDVLFVGTMNDRMYAFDAGTGSPTPLWVRDFTNPPAVTAVPITDIVAPDLNIVGNVGIQGTPVIDRSTSTLYVVARTKESGKYFQRLHALDLASGRERSGSPVTIGGEAPGTAGDSYAGVITFDPKVHIQRAGLALSNGVVIVAWAAHEDVIPSHGWIMGFDAATLASTGVFAVTRDANWGGIWQGGRAPALDGAGNAYFATGNGKWDGTRNFGNSLLKFSVSRSGFGLLDYFTPDNEARLSTMDADLSGSGFTLLPGTNLLLGGGKEGVLYLIDAANLGKKVSGDTQIVQKIATTGGHVMGGPVYWNSNALGPMVYNWPEDGVLTAYRLSGGRLQLPPYGLGQVVSPGHPGGSLTISANGSTTGSGVLWASLATTQDGIHGRVAGVLRAVNADTLDEIWTSEQNLARDRVGTLVKFVPPVVANGKVYLPNHDGEVNVYGLLPQSPLPSPSPSGLGAIGIDFSGSGTAAMTAAESAGVVPKKNWNNAAGASRTTPLALTDETGVATTATVTWSAAGTWLTPIADQPGNLRLMKGYLDSTTTSSTVVTVTGLSQRSYDVYVYADGDNRTFDRSAIYRISGPGITTTSITLIDAANTNFSGTLAPATNGAGNYVKFTVTATGFTLTAIPATASTTNRRAPVNAVQIVPVPTAPSAAAISVNFAGSSTPTMAPSESAGVVATTHWNNAAGAVNTSPVPLIDDTGVSSSATIQWTASSVWDTPITDQAGPRRMMKGYLDTTNTSTTTLTVAGLPSGAYDVYVYADGDNRSYSRTAAYSISGPGITTATRTLTDAASTNFSGAFIAADASAGNYVTFRITASGFTLTAVPQGLNTPIRAPISGLQIVPAR